MLDPWYERNVLGLMNLPMDVLCQVCACQLLGLGVPLPRGTGQLSGELLSHHNPVQQAVLRGHGMEMVVRRRVSIPGRVGRAVLGTGRWVPRPPSGLWLIFSPQSAKPEAEPQEDSQEQLPILADMILYYCRFATRPVLLQLYQTEVGEGAQPHLGEGKRRGSSTSATNSGAACEVDGGMAQPPHAGGTELSLLLFPRCPQCFGWCSWLLSNPQVTRAVFHPNTISHDTKRLLSALTGYSGCWKSLQCYAFQTRPLHEAYFPCPIVCTGRTWWGRLNAQLQPLLWCGGTGRAAVGPW